jgi:hypothetical protein
MTRTDIEAQLRAENPTTTDDTGERHSSGSPVYEALIEKWADAMEAQEITSARSTARSALAAQWSALPSWIRGPFGSHYASATHLLDVDDDDAAADLIRYAAAPAAYSADQNAVFEQVRAGLLAAIDNL